LRAELRIALGVFATVPERRREIKALGRCIEVLMSDLRRTWIAGVSLLAFGRGSVLIEVPLGLGQTSPVWPAGRAVAFRR
jgi:hypothetical protein